jgi:glycosyltransferase involved in cell wall biosynthesis
MSKLDISPDDANNVEFIIQNVEYNEMPNLYHRGDVFVSSTMGEAFNIPCLEAMACCLPVIATNYGGQTDFVTPENGWLVDYDLVDVTLDMQYEGNKWAKPRIIHLRQVMRDAFINQNSLIKKREKARQTAEQYTWENSAQKLLSVIESLSDNND